MKKTASNGIKYLQKSISNRSSMHLVSMGVTHSKLYINIIPANQFALIKKTTLEAVCFTCVHM